MKQTKRQDRLWLAGFAVLLAGVSLVAAWVGLSGSWVADDWHMVDSYLYGDWAELGAVFTRNAGYYLFTEDKVGPYRPVTMLTLLGTHLLVPKPWLHHAVSWLLHFATALLLFAALRVQLARASAASTRQVDITCSFVAGVFFIHPVFVEAYVWINGRSDLLGGFWLVALVFFLASASRDSSKKLRIAAIVGLIVFLGAGSKLPFVVAAVAVWAAWTIRERSPDRVLYGGAVLAGVAIHAGLRSVFAPFSGQLGTSDHILFDPSIWQALPKLLAQGFIALLSFRAEAMQSLSWTLFGPWSPLDWVGIVLIIVAIIALMRARDLPGLVYFLGAFAALAPVVVVSRSFWMGFDRYLYMPAILILLSAAPYVLRAIARGTRQRQTVVGVACLALLVFAAVQTTRASNGYASQDAYDRALLRDHPDDPSIHYYFARAADRSGDLSHLRSRLTAMPSPPWPRAIIIPTYELAAKASEDQKAREAIEALADGRHDAASCSNIRAQLETWQGRAPNQVVSGALTSALSGLDCPP